MLALGFWVSAPFTTVIEINLTNATVRSEPASLYALMGIFSVFALSLAWYANVSIPFLGYEMVVGRFPNIWGSTFSLALAATVLLPIWAISDDPDLSHWALLRGTGVWLWLLSFAAVEAAALHPYALRFVVRLRES